MNFLNFSIAISNKDVMIINSKCITYIKCLDEDPVENILFTVDNIENSNGSTYETMKLNLKNCLEERLFNVQVEGDILNIDDICIIKPPYGAQQCICDDRSSNLVRPWASHYFSTYIKGKDRRLPWYISCSVFFP